MNPLSQILDKDKIKKIENMESMLTHALVSGNSSLWHWEHNAEKVYFSSSYYLLLGYLPYESRSEEKELIDHIHPGDKIEIEQKFKQAMVQEQQIINLEFRAMSKTGKTLWMSCNGQRMNVKTDSKQKKFLGVISNISKYKEVEKILAENERRIETLMNHLPGMVYRNRLIEGEWNSEFVSNGVKSLLGYNKQYFMDNRMAIYSRCIDAEDRKQIWKAINKSIEEMHPFEVVYRIKTATDEYKWVWEKGEVLMSENGSPLSMEGFIMDITTFKHEEFRLQSFLRSASRERYRFGDIIGKSPAMQKIYELISTAAMSDANVIIYGESGTGKELVARAIHKSGKRNNHQLIIVNCGAISEKLLESEFFGYKKGAFTGAQFDKQGFLAAAEGGTLFLDELGEISLEFQVKLLRVLDGHDYTPVGSNINKKANVRIIAATNRNLDELVKQGKMRKDFFYRIHIIPITTPPLRKRRQDIPLLIDHFLEKHQVTKSIVDIPGHIRDEMYAYSWPGNIRELENVIQRYVVLGEVEPFGNHPVDIPKLQISSDPSLKPITGGLKTILEKTERQILLSVLRKNEWRRGETAKELKLTPRTLYRKIIYHRIKPT